MQITIQLDHESRRPIANLNWFRGCRALVDTGALFPIWNGDGKSLEDGFHDKLQQKDIIFGGFGGKAKGDLYRVHFEMNGLYYLDMPIIASELKEANWNIILSATMFDGMIYEIDTISKRFNIDTKDNQPIRILRLSKDKDNHFSVYLAETYNAEKDYYKNKEKQHQSPTLNCNSYSYKK